MFLEEETPQSLSETSLSETSLSKTGLFETGLFEICLSETGLSKTGLSETSGPPTPQSKKIMCTTDCCSYADVQLLHMVDGGGGVLACLSLSPKNVDVQCYQVSSPSHSGLCCSKLAEFFLQILIYFISEGFSGNFCERITPLDSYFEE